MKTKQQVEAQRENANAPWQKSRLGFVTLDKRKSRCLCHELYRKSVYRIGARGQKLSKTDASSHGDAIKVN